MKKQEYINGEDLIRKKMLEEEQAFEPEAWTKMEALLEQDPPAPVPGGSAARPVVKWLALIGLCIAAWWLFQEMLPGSAASEPGRTMVSVEQGHKPASAGAINPAAKTPIDVSPAIPTPNSSYKTGVSVAETKAFLANGTQRAPETPESDKPTDATKGSITDNSSTGTGQISNATPVSPSWISGDMPQNAGAAKESASDQAFANPAIEASNPAQTIQAGAWSDNLNDLPMPLFPLESIIRPVQLPQHDVAPSARRVLAIGYGLGFNAALPQYGISQFKYAPHISLALRYNFNNHLALRSELTLRRVDGYALSAHFADSTFRPTGELLVYDYQVGSPGFLYIDMPVLLTYRLGASRSALMVGLRPGLVFPSDNWASMTGNWIPPNGYNDISQGIRRLDCAVTLGWEYRLAPRFYIDLRYSQGWNDLTHDNFFQHTQTHLSSDIQLSFRHFFTQKP